MAIGVWFLVQMDIFLPPNGAAKTYGPKPVEARAMGMRSGQTTIGRDERGQND
jgi:hypothetical protein